ncbi:Hsp20/alpha crystallin family protein [Methylomonas sp. MgM2]
MKNHIIAAVAIFFAVVLGIQTYMLFRLHDRVDQLSGQRLSNQKLGDSRPNIAKPPAPGPLPDQDFLSGQPWNPYAEMHRVWSEMEKLFEESSSRFHLNSPLGSLSKSPAIDLQDKPDHYLVTVNAPGADESSINVRLDGQLLSISVKTDQSEQEAGGQNSDYRYRERFVGEFHRVLTLPGPVDADNMNTEYRNGVLTITIPKKP